MQHHTYTHKVTSVDNNVKKLEHLHPVDGNVNSPAAMENNTGVPQKY
jgi:hypothetical protein